MQLTFVDFLRRRFNGRQWAVACVRRGRVMQKYEVVLTYRQFDALKAEYTALTGLPVF